MSADWHLQKFFFTTLKAANINIYDEVPEDPVFPYVTLGEFSATQNDDNCGRRWQIAAIVNVFSRYKGYKETKLIQADIDAALSWVSDIANDYNIIKIVPDTAQTFRDPDGLTRRGVQTWTVMVTQN